MVGTLPEMVQTIVPKDFTQYCSSPPLCTMISYGYTLSLERIFCLVVKYRRYFTEDVVGALDGLFARYGYVDQVVSDNGPQFRSWKFENYKQAKGIKHHLITPY